MRPDRTYDLVRRFARTLRLALHDRQLEKDHTVRYYFDTDVVLKMIRGFREFIDDFQQPSSPDQVKLRALLSAGLLGHVHLLRPHALELDQRIRTEPTYATKLARDLNRQQVEAFLGRWRLTEVLEQLARAIKDVKTDQERVQRFLDELRRVGAQNLVLIELVNGSWPQRLRRLWGSVVRPDPEGGQGTGLGVLLDSEPFYDFNRALLRLRPQLSTNNVHDAAALALLSEKIALHERGGNGGLVRFYTETNSIERALREDPKLQRYLTEGVGGNGRSTILRDSRYFLLRAAFEALRFPGMELRSDEAVGFDDLIEVEARLADLMEDPPAEFGRGLERVTLGGRPILEAIEELQSLSLFDHLLTAYELPEGTLKFIEDLGEVWTFAGHGESHSQLRREIHAELDQIQSELRAQIGGLATWFQLYEDLHLAATKLREGFVGGEDPEPLRDLGLVRWGAVLDEEARDWLRAHIRYLFSAEVEDVGRGCARFAARLAEVKTLSDCMVVCAVLWLLQLWGRIRLVIDEFENQLEGALPPELRVLRTAAILRLGESPRTRDTRLWEELYRPLDEIRQSLEGERRGGYCLGLGYVAYYIWDRLRGRDAALESIERWAERSFAAGREAIELLEKDTLAWAFAVNHCAFVGSVTGVEPDETADRLDDLPRLQTIPGIGHYRFIDTLAYHHYLEARRRWMEIRHDPSRLAEERRVLVERLREADRLLKEAEPNFGDPEIPQHRAEVQLLLQRLA